MAQNAFSLKNTAFLKSGSSITRKKLPEKSTFYAEMVSRAPAPPWKYLWFFGGIRDVANTCWPSPEPFDSLNAL
jgi:hypothetical protein